MFTLSQISFNLHATKKMFLVKTEDKALFKRQHFEGRNKIETKNGETVTKILTGIKKYVKD